MFLLCQAEVTDRRAVNVREFPWFQIENRFTNKKVIAFRLKCLGTPCFLRCSSITLIWGDRQTHCERARLSLVLDRKLVPQQVPNSTGRISSLESWASRPTATGRRFSVGLQCGLSLRTIASSKRIPGWSMTISSEMPRRSEFIDAKDPRSATNPGLG
jgi:hypothetical protein